MVSEPAVRLHPIDAPGTDAARRGLAGLADSADWSASRLACPARASASCRDPWA
jgi:hypothetical protein